MTTLLLEPKLIEFSPEQRDAWVRGDRDDCFCSACAGLSSGKGIRGFGEYITGRHWQDQDCLWVHHDFDVFGLNTKTYESQAVLESALGERLAPFQQLCRALKPFHTPGHRHIEQPDLMIYSRDLHEVRFAECKRNDSTDFVNERQALGLFLLSAVLGVPADVYIVAEAGSMAEPLELIRFDCALGIERAG